MASFNRVILVGNLTRDPQVKYTPGGQAVSEIGLAVNRSWFDKTANQKPVLLPLSVRLRSQSQ